MTTYPQVAEFALTVLRRAGLLDDAAPPVDWAHFDRVEQHVHERFTIPATTCTLAMAHFLFAAAAARQPAVIVGAGTYVGYMLAWLVAGATAAGSEASGPGQHAGGRVPTTVAVDVDARANEVAARNFRAAGLLDSVRFVTADACDACAGVDGIDLLLVDIDEPRARKHRYTDVLAAALPNLAPRALVLAHDPLVGLFERDMRRFEQAVERDQRLAGPVVLPLDECGIAVVARR